MGDPANDLPKHDEYTKSKTSKFRFKSESRARRKRSPDDASLDDRHRSPKHHRSDTERKPRRHRHGEPKRAKDRISPRTVFDHTYPGGNGEYSKPDNRYRESLYDGHVDVDSAFRESLFDALADDEGAAYWEGVYGQPIHEYAQTKQGPKGELEEMNDDEYANYVRTKMWEKSHEYIIAEREAYERERRKRKEQQNQMDEDAARQAAEDRAFQHRVQESLKRGEERKRAKEIDAAWKLYAQKWQQLKIKQEAEDKDSVQERIPWPILSGNWKHVSKDEIEYFFKHASAWKDDPKALLKIERVRWHPDKMQQRFGQHIDGDTMKSVTAVFQVVDRLWDEQRGKA